MTPIDMVEFDVRQFHQKFGRPIGRFVGDNFNDPAVRRLRAALVLEEAMEFVEAMGFEPIELAQHLHGILSVQRVSQGEPFKRVDRISLEAAEAPPPEPSLPKAMDAVADIIYVALGSSDTFGVQMGPVWAEVQKTNMAKEGGASRPDGKLLKPPGWRPPDVEALLVAQGWKRP